MAVARTLELLAHVDNAGVEVHLFPGEAEDLTLAHSRVEVDCDQVEGVAVCGGEQSGDLLRAEDPLLAPRYARSLVGLELGDGTGRN